MVSSVVTGVIISDLAGSIHDAVKDTEGNENHSLHLAGQAVGAIIGFGITKSPVGALVGSSVSDGAIAYFETENPEAAKKINDGIQTFFTRVLQDFGTAGFKKIPMI